MADFFLRLFETDGFPPRWTCGTWSAGHGWLHILSDVAIFGAYAAIPLTLIYFIRHRRDVPFTPIFGLFALFIICCGLTHLLDAVIFWHPWYRFSGLVKAITAVVSWLTVVALIRVLPQALALPGLARINAQLKQEIEERKQAEAELIEARRTAEAANAAKDRFLAVLSHELRTPLTPVLMAVEAMNEDDAVPSGLRLDLAMISRNIGLEIKLIDDLLDLSRITQGKVELRLEWVDPVEVVRNVRAICQPQILEKQVRLEMDSAGAGGRILADPARLQQVLWNVLRNAVKFTPEGGLIQIAVRRVEEGICEFRVQDNGRGIPAGALPHIFNAFEQGDAQVTRQFGGLGLGLAISRALIERHGGSIRAESAGEGQGAVFVVSLPGLTAGDAPADKAVAAEVEASGENVRILLVEDHADTARTLARLLTGRGFLVQTAASLEEALQLAVPGEVDLLVSDLGLPDGNGCDLMRVVRENLKIPGIAMSGYGMEEDMKESSAAGFSRHLVKPVIFADLLEAVHLALAGRGKETNG